MLLYAKNGWGERPILAELRVFQIARRVHGNVPRESRGSFRGGQISGLEGQRPGLLSPQSIGICLAPMNETLAHLQRLDCV